MNFHKHSQKKTCESLTTADFSNNILKIVKNLYQNKAHGHYMTRYHYLHIYPICIYTISLLPITEKILVKLQYDRMFEFFIKIT